MKLHQSLFFASASVVLIFTLFMGFGCATKPEKPRASVQTAVTAPTPPSVPPVTNGPPPSVAIAPPVATTPAVYVPDMTHAGEPLRAGVLVWNNLVQSADAAADQAAAHFTFNFTNVSSDKVVILSVHPSCGCTTAELPPMPWLVDAGTNGQIGITVNLAGKTGMLFKTVDVVTDKGNLTLSVRINILPPVVPTMTEEDRARAMASAKVDRQAVFHGDCAVCHVKPGTGKYGQALYEVSCGICHEAEHRATMVPDLHAIKTPTNDDFWRTWIMHGKPGSLMPAFSTAEGGPLNDVQIASLAAYLNGAIPSKVPPPPQ
jgi:mono/diheme cytochrome c family protein